MMTEFEKTNQSRKIARANVATEYENALTRELTKRLIEQKRQVEDQDFLAGLREGFRWAIEAASYLAILEIIRGNYDEYWRDELVKNWECRNLEEELWNQDIFEKGFLQGLEEFLIQIEISFMQRF